MFSIRGAITIENDTKEEVINNTKDLLANILKENYINIEDIVSIFFTSTKDVKSCYPAIAARNIGIVSASLMCYQEMEVEGSLDMCIRVMLLVNGDLKQDEVKHIYMKEAKKLRPDLINNK